MTKQEKKNFKEVEKAFQELQFTFSRIRSGVDGNKYFKMNIQEAKEHDRYRQSGYNIQRGITITEEAKLFYVQQLAELITKKLQMPTIKYVLYCRFSWIFAGTLVENFREEITKALSVSNIDIILALDYAELVKADTEKDV